jgi:hypothetical protein
MSVGQCLSSKYPLAKYVLAKCLSVKWFLVDKKLKETYRPSIMSTK